MNSCRSKKPCFPHAPLSTVARSSTALAASSPGTVRALTVRIGQSRVRFVEGDFDGSHHLAFTIPAGTFDNARHWLEQRTPLLSIDDRTEFERTRVVELMLDVLRRP